MKTAVSIPDDLYRRAERLAARLGKSRSQIYREALADYVRRSDGGNVTAALDEVVDDLEHDRDWIAGTSRAALERSEW